MAYSEYERWKTTPIEDEPHISVVIPAYNEEIRIVPTIGAAAAAFSRIDREGIRATGI